MSGTDFQEQAMIDFCRENLANFEVPKRVVQLDSMPMTGSNKVKKNELRQTYETLFE